VTDYLSEPAKWQGHFWPAKDQAQARPGVLSYTPDTGIRLSLIGSFSDAKWVPAPSGTGQVMTTPTRQWPVVHGVAAKVPITLLDCIFQRGSRKGFGPELDEQEIRAERALIGIHLPDESDPSFTGIQIELENLTAWAFDSDITLKIGANQAGERCWAIKVEQTASRFAHLNGMKAKLRRGHVLIHDDRRRSHLNVATHEISLILFGSKQPRPLRDWLQMVDLLQDLITLAMDTPCAVLSQTVFPCDEAKNDPDTLARTEVPVYTQGILAAQPGEGAVRAYEALFTLNDRGFDSSRRVRGLPELGGCGSWHVQASIRRSFESGLFGWSLR
jgi:ApeA N-terminal domain 1